LKDKIKKQKNQEKPNIKKQKKNLKKKKFTQTRELELE
jgi:hypothetical protein